MRNASSPGVVAAPEHSNQKKPKVQKKSRGDGKKLVSIWTGRTPRGIRGSSKKMGGRGVAGGERFERRQHREKTYRNLALTVKTLQAGVSTNSNQRVGKGTGEKVVRKLRTRPEEQSPPKTENGS